MSVLGVILAVTIDLVLPAALIVLLVRGNYRRRHSDHSERRFWIWTAAYSALLGVWVVLALLAVPREDGYPVIPAVLFSLPMGAIPSIFSSVIVSALVRPPEWAAFGYGIVMPSFLVGLILWAVLLPVSIRAMAGIERINRHARDAEVRNPGAAA